MTLLTEAPASGILSLLLYFSISKSVLRAILTFVFLFCNGLGCCDGYYTLIFFSPAPESGIRLLSSYFFKSILEPKAILTLVFLFCNGFIDFLSISVDYGCIGSYYKAIFFSPAPSSGILFLSLYLSMSNLLSRAIFTFVFLF